MSEGGSAGGGFGVDRGKGHSDTKQNITMPDWLEPFVRQSTGTAGRSLGRLEQLSNQDTVADLTPDQMQGLESMRNLVGGDFFNTAQNVFMDTAQGQGLDFLDPQLREALMGSGTSSDLGSFVNKARDATAFTENDIARQALESTAQGDYLYGGEGFNAAVNAAVNAATPRVASAFGGSVGGAGGSGLAKSAIGQSALDAFAGQYGQERRNQLGAAGTLDAGGRADRFGYLGLADNQMGRDLAGQQMLAGMSGDERNRQMAAAAALPDIGMLDANTQMQIGEYLQGQQQREIDAPIDNQLRLLMAALQGPGSFSPYLGQNTRQDYRNTNYSTWGQGEFNFSDRRLKENVESIGEYLGRKFYIWTWKPIARVFGLSGPSIGVMADENPDVSRMATNGFMLVDYGAVFGGE